MFNSGFDNANFTLANAEGYKQVTWIGENKGKVLTIAIGGNIGEFKVESKSYSLFLFLLTLH